MCVLVLDVVNVRYPLKADGSDFALRVNFFYFKSVLVMAMEVYACLVCISYFYNMNMLSVMS